MKVLLVIWLLSAGIGVSYSVISERKKRVEFLGTMEQDLKKLACRGRAPSGGGSCAGTAVSVLLCQCRLFCRGERCDS